MKKTSNAVIAGKHKLKYYHNLVSKGFCSKSTVKSNRMRIAIAKCNLKNKAREKRNEEDTHREEEIIGLDSVIVTQLRLSLACLLALALLSRN